MKSLVDNLDLDEWIDMLFPSSGNNRVLATGSEIVSWGTKDQIFTKFPWANETKPVFRPFIGAQLLLPYKPKMLKEFVFLTTPDGFYKDLNPRQKILTTLRITVRAQLTTTVDLGLLKTPAGHHYF